ncbi:MAG TPA: hypothetical protein VFG14_16660, partial [Chthoniobacteraceae bacterium]|nr:hypothetical protein [Chthoniobacteraceae bacterium]
ELYQPDPPQLPGQPDAGYVPFVRVDKVNYSDVAPWPSGPDGTGNSLQRRDRNAFGNDPINWQAATPTPGHEGGGQGGEVIIVTLSYGGATSPTSIQFNTLAGKPYTVRYRDDLTGGTWQTLATIEGTGAVVTVQDSGAGAQTQRYYQVVTPS